VTDNQGSSSAESGTQLFEALRALQERYRERTAGLPQREAPSEIWAGVLFRVGEHSMLAPLADIGEILEVPRDVTPVPRSKEWVFGIANNRGTLLPMFDLRSFLFGVQTSRSARNRILVIRRNNFPVGLLASDVTGIRHFEANLQTKETFDLPDPLVPLATGGFVLGGRSYPMISLRKLMLDPRFSLTGI
jgi:twitching motility protein PilI